jgi:hypothetical protein
MIIKYSAYAIYSVLVLVFDLFWLLYMNTYWNETFIPKAFRSDYGATILTRFILANVESSLLLLLNKRMIPHLLPGNTSSLPLWTVAVSMGLVFLVTAFVFYNMYRHGL